MEARSNKTIICAVFFLDIAEYSRKSVASQISLKERFNAFLSIAIRDVPVADRIILDTGDGAAISFLGDIEDALQAALSVRSSLLGEGVRMEPPLLVRMGINLGPVRLVRDINSQPNIVGDGINVAQRIMGFADPGQILVSRSYFDAVSRLSHEYAGMFHYQGARTDKHVREHEVYAIGYPGDFTSTHRDVVLKDEIENSTGYDRALKLAKHYWFAIADQAVSAQRRARTWFIRATWPRRASVVAVAGLLLIGLAMSLFRAEQPPEVGHDVVLSQAVTPSVPLANGGMLGGVVSEPSVPVAAPPPPSAPPPVEAANEPPRQSPPEGVKIQGIKESARIRTLEETTGGPALVSLAVLPWGEVYLDGKKQGVSPPLLKLQIVQGRHTIEIRNTTFPVYRKKILAKAGTKITIRHSFNQVP